MTTPWYDLTLISFDDLCYYYQIFLEQNKKKFASRVLKEIQRRLLHENQTISSKVY